MASGRQKVPNHRKLTFNPCFTGSREILFFPPWFQEEAHCKADSIVQHGCLSFGNCWNNGREKYETLAFLPGRGFRDGSSADPSCQLQWPPPVQVRGDPDRPERRVFRNEL